MRHAVICNHVTWLCYVPCGRRYVHFVAGVDHQSAYPMLIHKACESFQLCIPRENFFLILHSDRKETRSRAEEILREENISIGQKLAPISPAFEPSLNFLYAIGVHQVNQWEGEFSSEKKMMQYMQQMKHVNRSTSFIYHSDVDEFPDRGLLLGALEEVRNGSCDTIK